MFLMISCVSVTIIDDEICNSNIKINQLCLHVDTFFPALSKSHVCQTSKQGALTQPSVPKKSSQPNTNDDVKSSSSFVFLVDLLPNKT